MSLYEELSAQRKEAQRKGEIPHWYTTPGFQLYQQNYAFKDEPLKDAFKRIAHTAASVFNAPDKRQLWENKFFEYLWEGALSPSTPVYNLGTKRGLPVSCAGAITEDSITGYYQRLEEGAVLTQQGHGIANLLTKIRHRGAPISNGARASGVMPVIKNFVEMTSRVAQGRRRGAWAGYLALDHPDSHEVVKYLELNPDNVNIGWCIDDSCIAKLEARDPYVSQMWVDMCYTKAITGKGYLFFPDKANRLKPDVMNQPHIPPIQNSQLCNEIMLPNDEEHTYSCILSAVNLSRIGKTSRPITVQDAACVARVFLDCICTKYIEGLEALIDKGNPSLKRIKRFTEKARAVGVGQMGWHSYLQNRNIPLGSFESYMENNSVASSIKYGCDAANKYLVTEFGEPEWCKGYGVRGIAQVAIAPTKSTALLGSSCSEGIEPWYNNYYVQQSAAGDIFRINPKLTEVLKRHKSYDQTTLDSVAENAGSVQHLDFLTDKEKEILRTAFETDQYVLLKQAEQRQPFIDQGQSLNLFASKEHTTEKEISDWFRYAVNSSQIKGLYYLRGAVNVKPFEGECESCSG